tara:strand:+ start:253 stop:1461 length:1209 start_codon:yes stop_codon:yes gene_type:complete
MLFLAKMVSLAFGVGFTSCSIELAEPSYEGTQEFHVRVIMKEDPARNAVIAWTGHSTDSSPSLAYAPKSVENRTTASVSRSGLYIGHGISNSSKYTYYHTELTDLSPDTMYKFRICQDQQCSMDYSFKTAPSEGPMKLMFGGDSRSDRDSRFKMNRVMKYTFTKDESIIALVHGGDYIDSGSNLKQWFYWLDDHADTTTDDGRLLPIIPTRGNHENNDSLYKQIFGFPDTSLTYYSSKLPGLNLIVLDTEISYSGDQRVWLDDTLSKSSQDTWILANYHRPAFPAVKSPSAARKQWVPLFEKYGVDLVFESDGHAYKQTAPIFQEKINYESGIIYVGEGGLGVRQRTPDSSRWYFDDPSALAIASFNLQILTITPEKISFLAIDEKAQTISSFVRKPRVRNP